MKIFDAFTFNNEFDLLELRLQEHWDHVDNFIIVEASTTFTNKSKPLYLLDHWERFKPFSDKITHVQVNDMPGNPDPWVQEAFQRNAIARGLSIVCPADEDIILVGDCDEIWRTTALDYMRQSQEKVWCQRAPEFYFKLNYMKTNNNCFDVWSSACRYGVLKFITPDDFRRTRLQTAHLPYNYRTADFCSIPHAGWHFGWLGDRKWALEKLASWSHQEWSGPDTQRILDPDTLIAQGRSFHPGSTDTWSKVIIDDYFPNTILADKTKYSKWILPDAISTATEFLPV